MSKVDGSIGESFQHPVALSGKTMPVKRKLMVEILDTLGKNKDKCAAGRDKRVGHLTQEKRKTVILGCVADLYKLGYFLESMHNLKEKHILDWVSLLVKNKQAPSTIQNKLSVLRIYCSWIGKIGMVKTPGYYVLDARLVTRQTATKVDKSWDGHDMVKLIKAVCQKDEIVGMQLKLCNAFGLRRLEAIMLKPFVADEGDVLHVRHGTKGGRPRLVLIRTEEQRAVLEEAKAMVNPKLGRIGALGKSLKQAVNRFKYVMRYCGITKAGEGVTAHGLRHGYVHRRHEMTTGVKLPVKGGRPGELDPVIAKIAKLKLMEEVGHSRVSVMTAYGGSFGHAARKKCHYPVISARQNVDICACLDRLDAHGLS